MVSVSLKSLTIWLLGTRHWICKMFKDLPIYPCRSCIIDSIQQHCLQPFFYFCVFLLTAWKNKVFGHHVKSWTGVDEQKFADSLSEYWATSVFTHYTITCGLLTDKAVLGQDLSIHTPQMHSNVWL